MPDLALLLPLAWGSVLLPFAAALAVLAISRAMRRRPAAYSTASLAVALTCAYAAIVGTRSAWPPQSALDWTPWLAIAGAAAARTIENKMLGAAAWVARAAVAAAAGLLVVWPALQSLGAVQAGLVVGVAALAITLAWSALAVGEQRSPAQPLLLAFVAGGAGLAMMIDSSQSAGRLGGAVAAALAGWLAFDRLRSPLAPAAAGVAVLLLGSLLLNAYVYGGFSLHYVAMLFAALLSAPLLRQLRERTGAKRNAAWGTATVLLAVAPVAITVGLAAKAMQDAGGY